eukprot:Blabericola_migrator_1__5216@NODE_2688_length_2459_cov_58_704013_g1680_i0_p1_GENE_NODE_2688_length_2459_cov_58_704013_g1680_i0NODE_2688_length_2459_cov_58_704013_g1680_i0_p1_ORF_typecomplete_len591_score54_68Ras/PF00071_22/1_2e48Kelch_3/PF13415_6/1_8e02Kelch_3/PF13415_6/0_0013Kelch_3/PF13415_6/1_1e06Kelch_3/PF13415_6/1_1e13Kelch_3/PF13415_6/0_82Kelch_3/PF13415_6/1_7Kelch_4/PF13418_6/0_16Kelch_4/PF13418_6/0_044Kelch_4/PF13418_6/7_5e09Kelch_4/PF13418_6/0_12Kelch_4/PF13418_6/0_004Kelch_4/PF13418_6/
MTSSSIIEARNLVLSLCEVKQRGDIPEPRAGGRMITLGSKCFLSGGFNERATLGGASVLDIESTAWSKLKVDGGHPPPLFGHTMDRYRHQLLIYGGCCTQNNSTTSDLESAPPTSGVNISGGLWKYDIDVSEWTTEVSSGPGARMFHASAVVSSKDEGDDNVDQYLIIDGGFDGSERLDDTWAYDLSTSTWYQLESQGNPPSKRFGHTMTPNGTTIYMLGGTLGDTISAYKVEIEIHESRSVATWSKLISRSHPPPCRIFHSAILMRPKWIFIFGGQSADQNPGCYIYDLNLERWRKPLSEGAIHLQGQASTQLMDKLLMFSGAKRSEVGPEMLLEDFLRPDKIFTLMLNSSMKLTRKLIYCTVLELKGPSQNSQMKFKIVTAGDTGVGKSCLLLRFVTDTYKETHMATVGADCSSIVTLVGGKLCTLQLWDTAGQERFANLSGLYFRDADGIALVFDMTRRSSFEHIIDWLDVVKEHVQLGAQHELVLIGNKSDLPNQKVTRHEAEKLAVSIGGHFVATSAKTADNVDMAFLDTAARLVTKRQVSGQKRSSEGGSLTLRLDQSEEEPHGLSAMCPSLRCSNG